MNITHTILITGSTGFIGRSMVDCLSQSDFIVDTLDRGKSTNNKVRNSYKWDAVDLIDLGEYDCIIHLAGKAHDTSQEDSVMDYDKANYELTQTIFNYWREHRKGKFIFLSSILVLGNSYRKTLVETLSPAPKTPYSKSKLKAEQYIMNHYPKEAQVYILRPSLIYGSGVKGNLKRLMSFVKKRIPMPLKAITAERSYLYLENLNFSIYSIITDNIESGIYHIADDQKVGMRVLIGQLSSLTNRNPVNIYIPIPFLVALAWLGDILRLPYNSEVHDKLANPLTISNDKLKRALGWDEMPFKFEQGIKDLIK